MATPYMIFPNEMTLTVDSLSHKVAERIIAEKPPIKLAGETYTEAEDNSHYPAHHVVIDPYIEFVDAKDKRIYRAEGVYETSNEMKLILALGEYRNIYIKDYILEVDDYSFNVIIKFRELVKGNPLENENNTSTVNLHFESKDRYISSIELEEWGKYAYCSGALMSNKEEGEIVYEIMLDEPYASLSCSQKMVAKVDGDPLFVKKVVERFGETFWKEHRRGVTFDRVNVVDGKITLDVPVTIPK
jgi:hypothetical protein